MVGVIAIFTSCNDDEPMGLISGYDNSALEQSVYADDSFAKDFGFVAAQSWTTQIQSPTQASVDWVTLSPSSGTAGDVNMKIALGVNYSGQDRLALVKIVCQDQELVLRIEQKGVNSLGVKPEQIPVIEYDESQLAQEFAANGDSDMGVFAFRLGSAFTIDTKVAEGYDAWFLVEQHTDNPGEHRLTINASPNYDDTPRVGEIMLNYGGARPLVITITQAADPSTPNTVYYVKDMAFYSTSDGALNDNKIGLKLSFEYDSNKNISTYTYNYLESNVVPDSYYDILPFAICNEERITSYHYLGSKIVGNTIVNNTVYTSPSEFVEQAPFFVNEYCTIDQLGRLSSYGFNNTDYIYPKQTDGSFLQREDRSVENTSTLTYGGDGSPSHVKQTEYIESISYNDSPSEGEPLYTVSSSTNTINYELSSEYRNVVNILRKSGSTSLGRNITYYTDKVNNANIDFDMYSLNEGLYFDDSAFLLLGFGNRLSKNLIESIDVDLATISTPQKVSKSAFDYEFDSLGRVVKIYCYYNEYQSSDAMPQKANSLAGVIVVNYYE